MSVFANIIAEFNPKGVNEAETAFDKFGKTVVGALSTKAIIDFSREMVNAAMDDEASMRRLEIQLKNTIGATDLQVDSVEKFVKQTQDATGVLDDQLRPALGNLVRATGDAQEAQDLLTLAIDVSVGTGRDLEAVSLALMKAHSGNVTALSRLGIQTKDTEGNTLSFDQVVKNLTATFSGQADAAMDTAAGRVKELRVQFEDAKEVIGQALIPVLGIMLDTIKPILEIFLALPGEVQSFIVIAGLGVASFSSLSTTLQGLGVSATVANKSLGLIAGTIATITIVAKIFSATSESNTKDVEAFTTALRENDDAIRANAIQKLAAEDPNVRTLLESVAKLGLTLDDLRKYSENMTGPAATLRDEFARLSATNDTYRNKLALLNVAMGNNIDLSKMTETEAKNQWTELQNLQFTLFNLEQGYYANTDAANATASALFGVTLDGEEAAAALDDVTDSTIELTSAWQAAIGYFDTKTAFNNIVTQFQEARDAAAEAFGKPSQENIFKYDEEVARLYGSVGQYITQLGNVPKETQTRILTALDKGEFDYVEKMLADLITPRSIDIGLNIREGYGNAAYTALAPQFRASGGSVSSLSPYIVGENGPELFMPYSDGQIVSNPDLFRIASSASITGGRSSSPSVANIVINMPSGANGDDVVRALQDWTRRNGAIPLNTTTSIRR